MANNEHISDDNQSTDKLATDISLKNSSDSNSSKPNMDSNKQVTKVFNLLLTQVIQKQKHDETKIEHNYFWDSLAPTILIKISIIGALLFFLLAFISTLIKNTIVIYEVAFPAKLLYLIIHIGFVGLFIMSYLIWKIRQLKSSQKQIEHDFVIGINEAAMNDWKLVEALVKETNYQKEILEYVEKKINRKLEIIQDREKSSHTLIQLCSVISLGILICILVPQEFEKLVFSKDIKTLPVVLTVLTALGAGFNLMYRFIIEENIKVQIIKLKNCICLLQQAQLLIGYFKENNKVEQSKKKDNKPSLMSRLRNISIEGPEDFAANHDLYISGEKRIEIDIH